MKIFSSSDDINFHCLRLVVASASANVAFLLFDDEQVFFFFFTNVRRTRLLASFVLCPLAIGGERFSSYNDQQFRTKYRIPRSAFFYLSQMCRMGLDLILLDSNVTGKGKTSAVDLMLAVYLMFLTRPISIQDAGDIHG